MSRFLAFLLLLAIPTIASAQPKQVVATCGVGVTLGVGDGSNGTVDTTGVLCASSTAPVGGATAANQATEISSLATIATNTAFSGTKTLVPLDVATVTTGGTAVTALSAGHRTKGGFLVNPENATINLCINEQAAASGTTSAGALVCIGPSQAYTLAPSALGVSVISSDSSHPFAGQGYN